jgi:hypothetical protein
VNKLVAAVIIIGGAGGVLPICASACGFDGPAETAGSVSAQLQPGATAAESCRPDTERARQRTEQMLQRFADQAYEN